MNDGECPAPKPTLLVADDDDEIRALIAAQLEGLGFSVRSAVDVASIRSIIAAEVIDLLVLDLTLPDGDGLALCRDLRGEGFGRPIIMVTARGSALDRVLGLELGADDYLVKPFEPRELVARIRNLLRRYEAADGRKQTARFVHIGPWRLDMVKRRLIASDDSLVMLSATEFEILSALARTPNCVVAREALLPQRAATVAFDRSIDTQISRLRQKLGASSEDKLILPVRGQGYLLACDVRLE